MTQIRFQELLGRLVTDGKFRERLRGGAPAPGKHLSRLERQRLRFLASEPGVGLTARLIESFRLGKLITLLPMTRTLLRPAGFARAAEAYFATTPPVSFYLPEEALAFCDYLRRIRHRPYLREVVDYEHAMIELKRPRPDGAAPVIARVAFDHDPAMLLPMLARGERPVGVKRRGCIAIGFHDAQGAVDWRVEASTAPREAGRRRKTEISRRRGTEKE